MTTTPTKLAHDGKEALADLLETTATNTKKVVGEVRNKIIDVQDASMRSIDHVVELIKRSPLLAVGIVAGVGIGIGYFVGFAIHRD